MDEMEQRVWQRVMGERNHQDRELKTLAMEAQEAISQYRMLQKSRMESHRELGRKLYAAEWENLACLKGMHYLQTGTVMKLMIAPVLPLDAKQVMRRYHAACRTLAEYTSRSAQQEWGTVFRAMADRQAGQCDRLCQLLGHMQ